jgi:hypothetical protein
MPLCQAVTAVVTPARGAWILNAIALIVSTRLTARLNAFSLAHGYDVKVHFFDEGAACVEHKLEFKWRYDMFHPLEKQGHDFLAERCDKALRTCESIGSVADQHNMALKQMLLPPNSFVWGGFDLISSVVATFVCSAPLCCAIWVFFL